MRPMVCCSVCDMIVFSPLVAGPDYSRFLALSLSAFEHVKDKTLHQKTRFQNRRHPFCQILITFTCSCGFCQRDTTSNWGKLKLNNLAVKG